MGPIEAQITARYRQARKRLYGGRIEADMAFDIITSDIICHYGPESVPYIVNANATDNWFADLPIEHRIIQEVAFAHDVQVRDMLGPWREKKIVRARHEAMSRLRHETDMSLPAIARILNRADHTTVMHGIRKHQERLEAGNG